MNKMAIIICISVFSNLKSQNHEVSIGMGFGYYLGDLNIKNKYDAWCSDYMDIKNYKMSYSLKYGYYIFPQFSLGISYNRIYLSGYDSDNEVKSIGEASWYRKGRNLSFYTKVDEVALCVRYEPFRSINSLKNNDLSITPILSMGMGLISFNPKALYNGKVVELNPLKTENVNYSLIVPVIPIYIGLKTYLPNQMSIQIDLGYRYVFSDYIDDVSTIYIDPMTKINTMPKDIAQLAIAMSNRSTYGTQYDYIAGVGQQRGDATNNDGYIIGQICLSYYFNFIRKSKDFGCVNLNKF